MKPYRHPETNCTFGQPADWDEAKDGTCSVLPVVISNGSIYSYWQPTWKERLQVLFGRPVRLAIFGTLQPPVMLDTERL